MASMDDILKLDAPPPPYCEIPVMEAGAFDAALLPGGRVLWRVPTDCAGAAAHLSQYGQLVVVTDDLVTFNRRACEEAGLL